MKIYLCNAFSLNMLSSDNANITVDLLTNNEARIIVAEALEDGELVCAIGHESTAVIIAKKFGLEINPFARITIKMEAGDEAVIAQYIGPRLIEGAVSLPEGAKIEYKLVSVYAHDKCKYY